MDQKEITSETPNEQMPETEYTSEIFKLEVKNLPTNFGFGVFKKFLGSLNLNFVKIKFPTGGSFAFVTFKDENSREHAFKVLNETKYKGKQLQAAYSKAAPEPTSNKRKSDTLNNENVKQVKSENLSLDEKVQNSTTPFWNISYDKQLDQKTNVIKQLLRKCTFKMDKVNEGIFFWLQKQKDRNEGMCCKLIETVPSPVIDDYRNKCEFTIGYNEDESKTVVGFRLGEYKTGSSEVVEPYSCKNFPDQMRSFVKKFHEFVENSEFKPVNVRTREGNWRQLTLRTNQNKEIVAIVVFDKRDLDEEEINKVKISLKKFFAEFLTSEELKLKGLIFNLNTNKTGISRMDNLETLLGEDCLYEELLGLKFRISPLAFFQANTKAAEVLYEKIGDISGLDNETILLDICCGTGTIGLTLANKCKKVIGVEIIPEAIEDAKLNAQLNNIENVEFHCGKAEDVLPNILKRFSKDDKIMAIVDPPRAGLHTKVVQALRKLDCLKSLVYVSCNPELAMQNFVDFARQQSKSYWNQAFVPTKAIAVDMFPHTVHCELVLFLTRYSNDLISNPPC
ncbi:tRNA (uracil-5-)-methyltransferase -like protein [Brachionus plicatilis]|uniref:tRNA (uracil(54)-C(5))-methyltransferase n=1 Tax=Brachionus plicatilis TaxID=10195 RepID=A0A3M7QEV8_BRAPC|nr:tRNA (uracil-5-)-methyltransferase -like protein [Brachionus plicatilis]